MDNPSNEADPDTKGLGQINVSGLISIIIFYIAILAVGIWAGWRQKRSQQGQAANQDIVLVGGRNIGLFVGVLTMTATWVGGGFLNGSAEAAYVSGLVWVQAPFGFSLSLLIGGSFFAKKMRDANYVTMIDPFTQKYGVYGALQALPAAASEIFWSAAILGALEWSTDLARRLFDDDLRDEAGSFRITFFPFFVLIFSISSLHSTGSTLQVILGFETVPAIVSSAIIAVLYTLMGGLVSVAYTDVFQIFFIAIGMCLALPFAFSNENVDPIDFGTTDWRGELPTHLVGEWIDFALLLLLGGDKTSSRNAVILSYSACALAILMAIPPTLFGAIGKATHWEKTAFGRTPSPDEAKLILPLCLQYLTPEWVAFFGLGAISAAVMSSTDSSMLSASSMLARNVYKTVFRPKASDKEILIVLWILIVINASIATTLAIVYQSVYNLFVLCGDFVYVIVFPQLLLVLYFDKSNTYGSVSAFFFALIFRLLCGDTLLNIPATISFGQIPCTSSPDCTETGPVPFRTIVMLLSLILHVLLSSVTDFVFVSGKVPLTYDFFHCFYLSPSGMVLAQGSRYLESVEEDMALEEMSPNEMALDKPDGLPTYDDACHNGDLVKTQHDVRT